MERDRGTSTEDEKYDYSSDASDSSLLTNYGEKTNTFRTCHYIDDREDGSELIKIRMRCAMSTRGRNLIVDGQDSTGIMIWPASYLLCQYLAYTLSMSTSSKTEDVNSCNRILELGCGCGIVGITAAITASRFRKNTDANLDIISTDMDQLSIDLCSKNMELNNLEIDGSGYKNKVQLKARTMTWGDMNRLKQIVSEFRYNHEDINEKVDFAIGADIVYPDISEEVLSFLFQTVSAILKYNGSFILSFVNRDYFVCIVRLINAANDACFKIDYIPLSFFVPDAWSKFLPSMLDAKLLKFTRASKDLACEHNNSLGFEGCHVFPGLRASIARSEEESSVEEWEAPGYVSDESNR